ERGAAKLEINEEVDARAAARQRLEVPVIVQIFERALYIGNVDAALCRIERHAAGELLTKHFVGYDPVGNQHLILTLLITAANASAIAPGKKFRVTINARHQRKHIVRAVRHVAGLLMRSHETIPAGERRSALHE